MNREELMTTILINYRNLSTVMFRKYYNIINKRYPSLGSFLKRIYFRKIRDEKHIKISGKHNVIKHQDAILSHVFINIKGNNNKVDIGAGSILKNVFIEIHGDGHRITIGKNCRFNTRTDLWTEDDNCTISIGDKTTFQKVHLAVTESNSKITIGKDCMFSHDIDVRTGDSHSIISTITNERINYASDINIGNHVWVSPDCTLLKGVCIADNSVVATGSIVTKSFDTKGILIAGVPAKQIKKDITWLRERI